MIKFTFRKLVIFRKIYTYQSIYLNNDLIPNKFHVCRKKFIVNEKKKVKKWSGSKSGSVV